MTEIKLLRDRIATWTSLKTDGVALLDVYRMAREESDDSLEGDLKAGLAELRERFDRNVIIELL
ncbi:MAG: hypothetical protein WCL50_12495, partial [Spirochaetota bacterium]